jgi:TetR/AcrR family transcriptional regulator, cholesterol catabolism regulator
MPPRTRRRRSAPRPADDRWAEILERAAEIFAAKGYERTTVRDIADALGLLSGSLYYYITTKEDLLAAILESFHERGRAAMAELDAHADPDPRAQLRRVIVRHVQLNAATPVETAVFHAEFRRLSPERREGITRTRREHEDRVTELIERAQRAGSLRGDVDARLAALSILAMLNGAPPGPDPGELQATLVLEGLTRTAP